MKQKILLFIISCAIALGGLAPAAGVIFPTPVIAAQKIKTGLYKTGGTWKYYERGVFSKKTGLVQRPDNKRWYYVQNGIFKKSTGLVQKVNGSRKEYWYVKDGVLNTRADKVTRGKDGYVYYMQKGLLYEVRPLGSKITWIGDSLSVLGNFQNRISGVKWYIHRKKTWEKGSLKGSGGRFGKDILNSLSNKNMVRPFLVVELGTNLSEYTNLVEYAQALDDLMTAAGSKTQVIMMTAKTLSSSQQTRELYNQIKLIKEKQYSNLYVADWSNMVQDKWFLEDNIHYNATGYNNLFRCIKDTLNAAGMDAFCQTYPNGHIWKR